MCFTTTGSGACDSIKFLITIVTLHLLVLLRLFSLSSATRNQVNSDIDGQTPGSTIEPTKGYSSPAHESNCFTSWFCKLFPVVCVSALAVVASSQWTSTVGEHYSRKSAAVRLSSLLVAFIETKSVLSCTSCMYALGSMNLFQLVSREYKSPSTTTGPTHSSTFNPPSGGKYC